MLPSCSRVFTPWIVIGLLAGTSIMAVACSQSVTVTPAKTADNGIRDDDDNGIRDEDDRCPVLAGCYGDEWMDMDGCPDIAVAFDVGASHLNDRGRSTLGVISAEVARLGARLGRLHITGAYDRRERVELAVERAQAVRDYLMTRGVKREVVRIDSGPESAPSGPYVSFEVESCETTTPRSDWWTGLGACPQGSRPIGFDFVQVYCATPRGTRHGRFNWWHGQELFYEGEFVHGKRHGTWVMWRRGTRITTARYEHGRLSKGETLWTRAQQRLACTGQPLRPDCDDDGVPASSDLCLTLPEDQDGYVDDDGCPEPDIDDGCPVESAPCPPGG